MSTPPDWMDERMLSALSLAAEVTTSDHALVLRFEQLTDRDDAKAVLQAWLEREWGA